MKKPFLVLCIFCAALLGACDDSEGRISVNNAAPAQVTGVTTTPGPGEVTINWQAPADDSYMYTKIEYTTSKGEQKYQLVARDKNLVPGGAPNTYSTIVSGFANTNPVSFALYACSVKGKNKGAVEVTGTPGTPAFAVVAQTIDVEPGYGGVNVSWENTSTAAVNVVLNYHVKADATKQGTAKFAVGGGTKGKRFVALATGNAQVAGGETHVINVTTQDAEENASDVFTFERTPKAITPLTNKAEWSVPGYVDAYGETIGYSSQEAGGEGATPKGRVVAMFDDNNDTFWHTAWKDSNKRTYPHFCIVDLGKDTEISNIGIRRRTGNAGTHKGQTIYTCPTDAAADSDPANWSWTDHGNSAFDPTTDNTQLFGFAQGTVMARYIKLYFAATDKGTSDFVMISELNVYHPAE